MTKALISILVGLFCVAAMADEELDPRVVAEAVKQMQLPADKVRELALHGCDSGITSDMRGCTNYWFVSSDLAMNDLVRQLAADRQGKPQQKLLLDSQRAWLAFRDTSCQFEASGLVGAQASVSGFQCMKAATDARVGQLQGYAACSGNAGCP